MPVKATVTPAGSSGALPGPLRLAAMLLVMTGLLALYLASLLGPAGLGAVSLLVLATWWSTGVAERFRAHPGLGRALMVLGAAAAIVDLAWLAETALDGFVHVLVMLILARLCALRSSRDIRVVSYLSFFMLVAASASSLGVGFLFVFMAFVALGTWVLLLQQMLSEAEPDRHRTVAAGSSSRLGGRELTALGAAAAVGALAVAGALFFVIPRVGQAALPLRMRMGPLVTGFSDRVELGAFGQIETDPTVVMRVQITAASGEPRFLPDLRWRGIVFDRFDGQAWTAGPSRRVVLRRSPSGAFPIEVARGPGAILAQDIYLEPLGTDVVFATPQLLSLDLRTDRIAVDDMGSVSVVSGAARLHYTAVSEVGDVRRGLAVGERALGPADRNRFLQLPALTPRIHDLAARVTAGSRGPEEAARRLTDYLSREYGYTLALARSKGVDPLEDFLFVRRAGNCEYFAAALAVMLRTLGIPSRVVGGFQRGDWNEYGRYFMVRMQDAHAWVEAHVQGVGWITLDPSPRQVGAPGRSPLALYLDALRMRWYRYVINWSLRDQIETALFIRHRAATWRLRTANLHPLSLPHPGPTALVAVAAAGVVLAAWRLWPAAGAPAGRARLPRFYSRALAALARRGLRPGPGETAREFCVRVGREVPDARAPLEVLTEAYERARFGASAPDAVEATALAACVRALGGPRSRGPGLRCSPSPPA